VKFRYGKNKKSKALETQLLTIIKESQEKHYRIAFSYVKNEQDALDVIQDSIYKALTSFEKVEKPEYLSTWLTRIVINSAIDHINKNKNVILMDKNMLEQDAVEKPQSIDDKMDINQALDNLNTKQRAVVILRFFEDQKFDEISRIMELPMSTVKSILYRSLEKMKIELKEDAFNE